MDLVLQIVYPRPQITSVPPQIDTKTKSFLKNREKMMKINRKRSQINHLHFSRGREKAMKISHPLRFTKNAGQTKKRELNTLCSITSLSH